MFKVIERVRLCSKYSKRCVDNKELRRFERRVKDDGLPGSPFRSVALLQNQVQQVSTPQGGEGGSASSISLVHFVGVHDVVMVMLGAVFVLVHVLLM